MSDASALTFPCLFPIKVIGDAQADFQTVVLEIFSQHGLTAAECEVALRASQAGRFQALTITFMAQNQAQLDAIYRQLVALPFVRMVL